jgi:hypothetical protein
VRHANARVYPSQRAMLLKPTDALADLHQRLTVAVDERYGS